MAPFVVGENSVPELRAGEGQNPLHGPGDGRRNGAGGQPASVRVVGQQL